jgi:hypothetical protein
MTMIMVMFKGVPRDYARRTMFERWFFVGMLFTIGAAFGMLLMLALGAAPFFRNASDGKGATLDGLRGAPGMRLITAGGAIIALVIAMWPAFTLAGQQPPLLVYASIYVAGFAVAGVLGVRGRRQSLQAMHERHAAELKALEGGRRGD